MVGFDMNARSDRAQLILVGAVAIAFIVLGLAVVFNTVLYTENVASTGAASAPRDAQIQNQEIEFAVKELIARTNVEGKWQNLSEARTGIGDNVSLYSEGLMKVQGAAAPTIVNVTVIDQTETINGISGSDQIGATIQQTDGGEFRNNANEENWTVVDGGAPLGDFNMTVKASSLASGTSDDKFRVDWNASSTNDNFSIWIYQKTDGDVAIQTKNDSEPVSSECVLDESSGENVEFDFSSGTIRNHSDCSGMVNISAGVPTGSPRNMSFHNGESASGWFSVTVNEVGAVGSGINNKTEPNPPFPSIGPSDSPYYTYGVWTVKLRVTYNSGDISFERVRVIEVYNRSR
jgi:hypothetical protein